VKDRRPGLAPQAGPGQANALHGDRHLPLPADSREAPTASPFVAPGSVPPPRSASDRRACLARPEQARIAIEHLLGSLDPTELTPDDFGALDTEYGLSSREGYDLRLQLWREALQTFCADRIFMPGESLYLIALGDAFGLPGEVTEPLRLQAAATQFRAELVAVMSDRRITSSERQHLEAVASSFGIAPTQARDAINNTARGALARVRARAGEGPLLSREGIEWFRSAAHDLGVVLSPAEAHELEVAEAHWAEVDRVMLERAREREAALEQAHVRRESELTRLRTAVVSFAAPATASQFGSSSALQQHLCEPATLLGWRAHPTNRFEPGSPTLEDVGHLVITSRELAFDGTRVTRRINLTDIRGAMTHPDGIVIDRSRDASVRFGLDCLERGLLIAAVLGALRGWGPVPHDARPFAELGFCPR
jgi:hypothetical protein